MAGAVAQALVKRLPTLDEQAQQATELARKFERRVNCPKLDFGVALKVAWACVEGRIKPGDVHNALHHLERRRAAGELTCPASAYFVNSAKRIFQRANVEWRRTADSGGPRP